MRYDVPLLGEPVPVEFANTLYARRGRQYDGIETPAHLSAWLAATRDRLPFALPGEDSSAVSQADVDAARQLRDAIRSLFYAVTEARKPDRAAARILNVAMRQTPWWHELMWEPHASIKLRTAGPVVPAVLSRIAEEAAHVLAGEHASEVRACGAPGCQLFYLQSHPRRAWCSSRCADRVRAARYYANRKREA